MDYTLYQINLQSVLVNLWRHALRGNSLPFKISVLVTRNLPVRIFSVSMSLLQSIMLPLRLMGLMIVTVALMKEPLLNVTFPNTCEEFSA